MLEDTLKKVRLNLVLFFPFFASIALKLKLEISDEVEVAATDGDRIIFNPNIDKRYSKADIRFIYLHEICHVVLLHMFRRGSKNPQLWNMACDYAVNSMLMEIPRMTIPSGGLYNFKYQNWSAEEIYEDLYKKKPEELGQPSFLDVLDAKPEGTPDTSVEAKAEAVKAIVREALHTSKKAGNTPAGLLRVLGGYVQPRLNYKELLKKYMNSFRNDDYRWSRPNPRHYPRHYLPSRRSEAMGSLSIVIDTSGSIDSEVLSQFESEIKEILSVTPPERLEIIYCDSEVAGVDEVNTYDVGGFKLEPRGGGGTDMSPAFAQAQGDLVICFTDMQMWRPAVAPKGKLVWVVWDSRWNGEVWEGFGEAAWLNP